MYIIVIGGGRVGYYLTKALIDEGHEVIGMWVIDHETPDVDVIKCRGDHVPADIRDRFKAWEKRKVGCI